MRSAPKAVVATLLVLNGAPAVRAAGAPDAQDDAPHRPTFAQALAAAEQGAPAPSGEPSVASPVARPAFGEDGYWSWTLGGGVAVLGTDAHAYYNGFVSIETFVVKDFQVAFEFGGWWFAQDGPDAGGGSVNVDFRYYFLPWGGPKDDWGVYAALGGGVLGSTNDVPVGGTEFNFTPRAGVGFSLRLGDGPERLTGGVRWQHISNANTEGNDRNPGSNALMVYLGVTFPF